LDIIRFGFIKYSCDFCKVIGKDKNCCSNPTCYQKHADLAGKADSSYNEVLTAAYKEYKAKSDTSDFEKAEKLKDSKFSLHSHFKFKIFPKMKDSATKAAGKATRQKPFSEYTKDTVSNQDKVSVPGNYTSRDKFSDY
jgi:hypothetical protein